MKREDLFENIDRQIAAERFYRHKIKEGITKFVSVRRDSKKKKMIIEKIFRAKIQKDLHALLEKKQTRIHNSTGMNSLEDLFSNTNLLSVLESDYYYLTTSEEQRKDYKNHVLTAVIGMFKNIDLSPDGEGKLEESLQKLFEEEEADIQVEVTDEDLPEDKIVGPARDEIEDEKEKDEDENAESIDPSEDLTGRNRAMSAISKIEKSIKDSYNVLGNPADKSDFKTYLIANLKLYFDQWENSLQNDANPQFSNDVEQAVGDAEAALADEGGEDTGEEGGDDLAGTEGEEELDLDLG
jgi:hypothetical protein